MKKSGLERSIKMVRVVTPFLSLKSIIRRKQRNIAVILGVALGVTLVAGIQISVDSSLVGWDYFFTLGLGQIDATITPNFIPAFNKTVTKDILSTVSQLDIVSATAARFQVSVTVQTEKGTIEVGRPFIGYFSNETGFGDLFLENKSVIDLGKLKSNEVVLGFQLAESLDVKTGDTLYLSATFKNHSLTGIALQVVGILSDKQDTRNFEYYGNFMGTTIENLWNLFGVSQEYNQIVVKYTNNIDTADELKDAGETIESSLIKAHPYLEDIINVRNSRKETLDIVKTLADSLSTVEWVFGSLIIFAALLVTVNIQSMSFEEREKNTAIIRAFGGTKGQIARFFINESLGLGVIGAFIGLIGGIAYGRFLVLAFGYAFGFDASPIPIIITSNAITTALLSGLIISFITAVAPAINASKVKVAQVLRGLKEETSKKVTQRYFWIGIVLFVLGVLFVLSLKPNPILDGKNAFKDLADAESIYLPVLFLLVGPGLIISQKVSRKIGLNFVALGMLGWALFNIFIVFDWIESGSGGMFYLIYLLFSLVIGTVILIGSNLSTFADIMEMLTQHLKIFGKQTQSIIMVSLRHMAKEKRRSTLTFALFASVLTLNIFIATWSYSTRYGLGETISTLTADSDILVYSSTPLNKAINFPTLLKNAADFKNSIDDVVGALYSSGFGFLNQSFVSAYPASVVAVEKSDFFDSNGDWKFRIDLQDNKSEKFETGTYKNQDLTTEDKRVWEALFEDKPYNETAPYPIIITSPIYDFSSFPNFKLAKKPGDIVYLPLKNGSFQPFVIAAFSATNPFSQLAAVVPTGNGITISGGSTWFINEKYAENITLFNDMKDKENVFLVKTPFKVMDDKNKDLATNIEEYANGLNSTFRKQYGFHGIISVDIYSIFEVQLEGQYRFFQYIQLFTSLGFLMGILGLLVVSIRSVAERKREIGMLRAIGISSFGILITVVLELLFIAFIGFFLGLLNGSIMGYALLDVNTGGTGKFLIPLDIIGLYTILTMLSAIIAAVIPGYRAVKIPASEALRYIG